MYGMWTQGIFWWNMLDTVGQWTPLHFIPLSTTPAPHLVILQPMYGGVQWISPLCRDNGAAITPLLRRQWAVSLDTTYTQKSDHLKCRKCGEERCSSDPVIKHTVCQILKDLATVHPSPFLLSSLSISVNKTVFLLHLSNPNKTHLVKTRTYQTKIKQTRWKCLWWKLPIMILHAHKGKCI